MSEEKTKLLNLMKFWLFGTFVIVWAAITTYIGLFTDRDWWLAIRTGFPIWGITAALTIIWYVFYRWWLGRQDESADRPSVDPAATGGSTMGGGAEPTEMGGADTDS